MLAHVDQALALAGPQADAQLLWRLHHAREQTLELQARRDEQGQAIESLEQLAEILDNDQHRAYTALRRSGRAMRMADWSQCDSAARRAMALAERSADEGLRLHALRLLALALAFQGEVEAGKALAWQGLADAQRHALRVNEAFLLNALAVMASLQEDVMASLDLSQKNLLIYRDLSDRRNQAVALANLGASWLNLGQAARAQRDLDEALPLLRANGDRVVEGTTLSLMSELALWRDDADEAAALAQAALEIAIGAQARDREVEALLRLGDAQLAQRRFDAARQSFERAHALGLSIDSAQRHQATAGLARLAHAQGDQTAALQSVAALLALMATDAMPEGTAADRVIEFTCVEVLAAAGVDAERRACEWLERAVKSLQAQADSIADAALREGFLHNIPVHRKIMAAWQTLNASNKTG